MIKDWLMELPCNHFLGIDEFGNVVPQYSGGMVELKFKYCPLCGKENEGKHLEVELLSSCL